MSGTPEISFTFKLPLDPRLLVRGHGVAMKRAWIRVMRFHHQKFYPLHFKPSAVERYGYIKRISKVRKNLTYQQLKDKLGLPPLVSPLERGGATRASVLTERKITATQKGGRLKVKIPIKGGSGRFRLLKGKTKLTDRQKEVRRRIDEITAVHPDELRKDEEKLHEFYAEEVEAIIFNQPTLVKSKHRIS